MCSTGPEIDDGVILQIDAREFNGLPLAKFRAKGTLMSVTVGFSGFHEGEISSGQIIFKASVRNIIQGAGLRAGYKEQGPWILVFQSDPTQYYCGVQVFFQV